MTETDPSIPPSAASASASAEPTHKTRSWLIIAASIVVVAFASGGAWWYLHRGIGDAPGDAGPMINVSMISPPGLFGHRWNRPNGGRNGGQNGPRNALRNLANRIVANMPDGVFPTGRGYIVRAGHTHLSIDRNNDKWQYNFSYVNETLESPGDHDAIVAMYHARSTARAEQVKTAGVTPDQIEKLKKIGGSGMMVDNADRQHIASLFVAFLDAAGRNDGSKYDGKNAAGTTAAAAPISPVAQPAEKALTDAVSALGQKQLAPSKAAAADHARQIHAILSDAQIAKLK